MLARFQMKRGAPAKSLPRGRRMDTRKHTRHVLRPPAPAVRAFLAHPGDAAWTKFRATYVKTLADRFKRDRAPFDDLAALARTEDVYLGCNCPTTKNPDVTRCHTYLALEFMHEHYPDLEIVMPA
jgi:hypothetical protein